MMQIAKTPFIIRQLLPKAVWHIDTDEKILYLTFDDGPTPGVTHEVLGLLDQYHAKATFFCIGKNVLAHREIVDEIINKGHAIGNHTQSHKRGWKTSLTDYVQDVKDCAKEVQSSLFRPPYGQISYSQYRYLHKEYKIIMWDVLSWDFKPENTAERCANHVINHAKPGSIIVFHDSKKAEKNCLFALQQTLEHFKDYEFKSLSYLQDH